MYRPKVKEHFDAAHYIKEYKGKCSREHGHRWEVEAEFEVEELSPINISIDFGDIKMSLKSILEAYLDHYQLNKSLDEPNVTAEYLARWVYIKLSKAYSSLKAITIWESPECSVRYEPSQGY